MSQTERSDLILGYKEVFEDLFLVKDSYILSLPETT